ncbi:MAG: hypothetical protein WC805_01380 [Patescibacteria group bacterium]|jgi:hypothetical protein
MKNYIVVLILVVFLVAVATWAYQWQVSNSLPEQTAEQIKAEPSAQDIAQVQTTIRDFMADQKLEIKYITTQPNPSNFTVGKTTQLGDGGGRIDTPEEWKRPVYVFQQVQYINERCEVYEYEMDARTLQIVDIHVRYPDEIQNLLASSEGLNAAKCASYGSMEIPLKPHNYIEQTAFAYLSRDPNITKQLLQSKSQFNYISSKPGAANPSANEWIWQDTSYKLPEGLTGDVYNYPTIRIIISSGGKLIHYFNSIGLFEGQMDLLNS